MAMGPYVDWRRTAVPLVPPDTAFDQASTWQLRWQNPGMQGLSEVLLQIDYTGDIARLRTGTNLLDDNFFNGLPWQIGLKRFSLRKESTVAPLTLQILPMSNVAPIYLDHRAWSLLGPTHAMPQLIRARLIPEYESVATITDDKR
jgi:hypothetical protein